MRLPGHCCPHENEVTNKAIVLWTPTDGKMGKGRREKTYIDNLIENTQTG